MHMVLKMLLKAAGYHYYEKLARITDEFIGEFIRAKNEALYGKAAGSEYVEQVTERLVMRDLKIAIRLSVLLRDQEWKGYLEKIWARQQRQWKFELQLYEKNLVEKTEELRVLEQQKEKVLQDKEEVEVDSLREGLRNLLQAKFRNEWRAVRQQRLVTETGRPDARINESAAVRELEGLVADTYAAVRDRVKKEDEEAARLAALAKGDADAPDPLGEARKKRGGAPKRRLTHSQTTDLAFASERQANEAGFTEAIEDAFDKVTEAMKLQTSQE